MFYTAAARASLAEHFWGSSRSYWERD